MNVLAEETWSWMLMEHEGHLLFTVLCGGIATYSIDFVLSESEQALYAQQGRSFLRHLAQEVTLTPDAYIPRRLQGSDSLPGLQVAVAAWRASNAAAP